VRTVLKVTVALGVAWLLAGCSAMRFAYEHADEYVLWRANSYLDLHGDAHDALEARVDDFFAWHRAKALPNYAKISEDAAQRMGKGLSRADLIWGYDSLLAQARESLRAAAERIAPVLDNLGPREIARMERQFAEDNRKFAKEFLRGSEADRRKRRAKRTQERLEDWVGHLNSAQEERVRQFSERAPLYDELRERDRKRLQGELLAMVRAKQARKVLPERAGNFDRERDPAHLAASEAARNEYYLLLLDLDKSLTAEQRARAVANFRRYAGDFTALAARGGGQYRAR
jgi:uncharacterized protein DUF6279